DADTMARRACVLARRARTCRGGTMNEQELVRSFAAATVALPGLLLGASIALAADGFPPSVPKAVCGPGDHTESGLQGETTVLERFGGDSVRAYNCNLELVGQEHRADFQGAYSQKGTPE